jgi:7,8-dihydropterin-6-yl-methyl-4-(beta-D-ribofuranosyl)aminobenzene 5'-phosphate synthase
MIIKALVENTSVSEEIGHEHGLSLSIETDRHRILFDMGCGGLFLKNAQKMDVSVKNVDIAVLSHGHDDHGGGLKTFLMENPDAKVYIRDSAFNKHLSKRSGGEIAEIGLDRNLMDNERIVFSGDYLRIDDELELFSGVRGRELRSRANQSILMEENGRVIEDTFIHEQNLIITEGNKTVLLSGCSHNGIINIINRFIELKGRPADYVIGGFHLHNPSTGQEEEPELVDAVGRFLQSTGAQCYTCHCTGFGSFSRLQAIMKDKIRYLAAGDTVAI